MLYLTFPSNQQSPKLVMPRMGPFHDPPARRVFFLRTHGWLRLTSVLQVQEVVPLEHARTDLLIIIAFVQAEMVQPIDSPLRPRYADAIDRLQGERLVWRIGSRHADRQGGTAAVSQYTAFGARFRPIHGAGPRRLPAQGRLGDHAIKGLPLPGDANFLIVVCQQHFPRLLKHARLPPWAEATVDSRTGRVLVARNRPPLTARAQDIEQRVEDDPKGDGRSPRRPGGFLWP